MLKKLSKAGEYTHMFLIGLLLIVQFFTDGVVVPTLIPPGDAAPFGQWIYSTAAAYPIAAQVVNLLLLLTVLLNINRITVSVEITPRQSYITATLLAALLLLLPARPFDTVTLSVFALLAYSYGNLMFLFGRQYPFQQVLNSAMAVAFASMIMPSAIFFILFIWIAFFTHSVNSWREWLISVLGILIPYIYLLFAFFWNDNLGYLFHAWSDMLQQIHIVFSVPSLWLGINIALLLLLYGGVALPFIGDASDKVISIRKRMWLTFQFSVVVFMVSGISGNAGYILLPLLCIPTAIIAAYYIYDQKRTRVLNIVLLLFLASVLFNRIFAG